MPKATITVQAPAEHPDVLDIRDAMQQVLDFFTLLSGEESSDTISWNLTFANKVNPFTAEAEAVSLSPGIDVRPVANARMTEASHYLSSLVKRERPHRTLTSKRKNAVRSFLKRNTATIGKTSIMFDVPTLEPVVLTPSLAAAALETAAQEEVADLSYVPEKRERIEFGSIEGAIVDAASDYNQPAIHIIERKSGREIACRVEQSMIDKIAASTSVKDVWEHKRVSVRGRIVFDPDGQISRVYAQSITPITPRDMTLKDIEDREFTGGLSISEYLDKLREGELG